ncbi:MAG: RHS repeat-associated core domain-containing protein, partial [Gemmataceae bacterium]|nr:RHS repeat-associated core domain-containing protein [Gemmataceae bacterium]
RTVGAAGATWVYGYDHRGQMVSAAYSASPGGTVTQRVTYSYDAFGVLIERDAWDGTSTTTARYGVDGWDPAKGSPTGTENFDTWADLDGTNALVARRSFGPAFDQVESKQTTGGASFYLTDRQGSVRLVANTAGTVTATSTFDAFGKVTAGALSDRFGYTGQEHDPLTGLIDFNARRLDPTTGRFTSDDPLGFAAGDPNLQRYVKNNATNATDPSGYHPEDWLTPGSRISNLLVREDQQEEVSAKIAAALGVKYLQTLPGPNGYRYIVLPPQALNNQGHERIVDALRPYQPGDQLPSLMSALYRGDIAKPTGVPNRYAVIDPDTGKLHLSDVADFGAGQVSTSISKMSPERLRGMVRDGLAREVDGYIYVAW